MVGVSKVLYTLFTPIIIILIISMKVPALVVGSLSDTEFATLEEITVQLGKANFTVEPCSNDRSNWSISLSKYKSTYNNIISCNCFFGGGCHITEILLTGQDLAGELPSSIAKLPHLTMLRLTRNYLGGSIPKELAFTKLEYLSISINHFTGPIPSFLGNIATLQYLALENNMFSGTIPAELGNLVNLTSLLLSANFLTGDLPLALTNLNKLKELKISSNNFTGKIPSFIQSWKKLQILEIQGSGLQGPIPSSISSLKQLTELRISDLHGEGSEFPLLDNMKLQILMLRNCNISGSIPRSIGAMPKLKQLDLSFNRLQGKSLPALEGLTGMENMYLSSNLLSGPISDWIKYGDNRDETDLSRNNFSASSLPPSCREALNLFKSTSGGNDSKPVECLKKYPCSKERYSVHINCGGEEIKVGSATYEADQEPGGPASYIPLRESWEFSNTGHFWDKNRTLSDYIATATNASTIKMINPNPRLYTTARLSPLSLTYYLRCLGNGNYTVKLHFAEIILRDNRSFYALGRRIFDVYVQEKHVLKDFNIAHEAKGVDRAIIKTFMATVRDGTLQVRFHWAGKGTTAAPQRGIYGPLISAIDVQSVFKPPSEGNTKLAPILGGVTGSCLIFLALACTLWKCYFRAKNGRRKDLGGLEVQTVSFTLRQIKAATNNFAPGNKIGEGGFGPVYKGVLADNTVIAVKQLSSKSGQGNLEFLNEIGMISCIQHPNLVKLHGCCIEGNQLLLVYEYMENNSLAHALLGPENHRLKLDWQIRQRICVGIARGLAFLHEESVLKIVHRDIKTTNVLLDKNLNPKISDFGLAKLDSDEKTHISTRVAGTIGYMAPEYALWGYLTYKADVYSFGIVALEIVSGKHNMNHGPENKYACLLDWAGYVQQKGNLMELVDEKLGPEFEKEEAERMIKIGLLCTNASPSLRPTMSEVVSMLQGTTIIPDFTPEASTYNEDLRFKAIREHHKEIIRSQDLNSTSSVGSRRLSSSTAHEIDSEVYASVMAKRDQYKHKHVHRHSHTATSFYFRATSSTSAAGYNLYSQSL